MASVARLAAGLGRDDDGLVICLDDGEPQNPRNFSKEFGRIAHRAKLRGVTFHTLRHTHATNLLEADVHPKVAQERLGHASISITLDTYSHVVKGMDADAARKVDAVLRAAIAGRKEHAS